MVMTSIKIQDLWRGGGGGMIAGFIGAPTMYVIFLYKKIPNQIWQNEQTMDT